MTLWELVIKRQDSYLDFWLYLYVFNHNHLCASSFGHRVPKLPTSNMTIPLRSMTIIDGEFQRLKGIREISPNKDVVAFLEDAHLSLKSKGICNPRGPFAKSLPLRCNGWLYGASYNGNGGHQRRTATRISKHLSHGQRNMGHCVLSKSCWRTGQKLILWMICT